MHSVQIALQRFPLEAGFWQLELCHHCHSQDPMAAVLASVASAHYDACSANGNGRDAPLEAAFWQLELCHHHHSLAPMAAALALMASAHYNACGANGKGQDVPLEAGFWQLELCCHRHSQILHITTHAV